MIDKTIDIIWHRRGRRIPTCNWSIEQYAEHWRSAGWTVRHLYGVPFRWHKMARLTLMHVDVSVVPSRYCNWAVNASRQGLVWNARADDIRKSQVSSHLLLPGDGWAGQVIVKTDRNFGARPEGALGYSVKKQVWRDAGNPVKQEYLVQDSLADVPDWAWESPHWVVERYFGAAETESSMWTLTVIGTELELVRFSTRSQDTNDRGRYSDWEVHDADNELKEMVAGLGIEYGRLDLFRVANDWVLIDVNKTPGQYPRRDAGSERQSFYDQRISSLAQSLLDQLD